jgi:crotonobetainyl-CoA:carnitine CoA-transferase CaiB-like acyl-CoA transferase
VRASATPAAIRRPAPLLGEHTAEILDEIGVASDEIERLVAAGTIAVAPPPKPDATRGTAP